MATNHLPAPSGALGQIDKMAAQAGIVPSPAQWGDISHQCSDFCGKVRPELVERASLRRGRPPRAWRANDRTKAGVRKVISGVVGWDFPILRLSSLSVK